MPRGTKPPVGTITRQLGAIIRGELAKQGHQHAEVADVIGVHRNHLSRMLNGRAHIDVDQLAAMCEFLGLRMVQVVEQAEREAVDHPLPLRAVARHGATASYRDPLDPLNVTREEIEDAQRRRAEILRKFPHAADDPTGEY